MLDVAGNGTRLRRLRTGDLAAAQALSTEFGWPHRVEDWEFVHRLGHGLAMEDASGALIGTALWWPFGSCFATLGLVIVSGRWQRQGIGNRLLTAVLDEIGPRATLLNGTRGGLHLYERAGFRAIGIVRQYRGTVVSMPGTDLHPRDNIRPFETQDFDALVALDEAATGMPRANVLTPLLEHAAGAILERNGEIAGFAGFRRFGRGYVIGPVVASDEKAARALISHWLQANAGMFVRIDIPIADPGCWAWLLEAGLGAAGEVTTMVRGAAPKRSSAVRTFGLINQAMG